MNSKNVRRLTSAAALLGPRTLVRKLAAVDQLLLATREMSSKIDELRIRTEQLLAIEQLNWEQRAEVEQLSETLDPVAIGAHVRKAIASATLHLHPFPHIVVERWLPIRTYELMIRALPPAIFFADRDVSRQRLMVPFAVAPELSRRVWEFIAGDVGYALRESLAEKFRTVLQEYIQSFCPGAPSPIEEGLTISDGRIMLRRAGYVIQPHRDPRWGFVTGLVYLARPGDNETYGTQLYRVRNEVDAPNDKPLYIDDAECDLVKSVPFRRNTLLVFLNSVGAHGASIPADADPVLERYVYQFRLGPTKATMAQLIDAMPAEAQARWAGAKTEKARLKGS